MTADAPRQHSSTPARLGRWFAQGAANTHTMPKLSNSSVKRRITKGVSAPFGKPVMKVARPRR